MYFLDNSGHIFLEQKFSEIPIGHEYNEHENIFWIKNNDQYKLSVNNYYGRTINMLIPLDEYINENNYENADLHVDIECESNIFHLLPAYIFENVHELNLNRLDLTNSITDTTKQVLSSDNDSGDKYDLMSIFIEDDNISNVHKYFALIPIYIVACAKTPGTWITNLLIHVKYNSIIDEYASISVGVQCYEENEILSINMGNFGIKLPKDILHAVYDVSFYNNVFDEVVWNQKVKEYLLNYMDLRGQNGNFNSAIKSLQWFGYGDKINIVKLLKTDNDLKTQFVRDYFNLSNDIIESFSLFQQKTLISIFINGTEEVKDEEGNILVESQKFDKDFFGEEKPYVRNLFKTYKYKEVGLGKTEKWKYIVPYYKYTFNELALKLACLNEYYDKYFLPLHISLNTSAIQFKTYMDDTKFTCYPNTYKCESPILVRDHTHNDVTFPKSGIHWFNEQIHIVDRYLNEFSTSYVNSQKEIDDLFYIHETCANIPIKFNTKNKIYNCVLLLEEINNDNSYECYIDKKLNLNDNFRCTYNGELYNKSYLISYSYDNKNYSQWYNSINEINEVIKNENQPLQYCEISKSITGYYITIHGNRYILHKHKEKTVRVGNIDYIIPKFDINSNDNIAYVENKLCLVVRYNISFYIKLLLSTDEVDGIILFNNDELTKIINNDYIFDIDQAIENKYILTLPKDHFVDYTHLKYQYIYNDKLIFESHFSFYNLNNTYQNFIIYPRLLNHNDDQLEYWIENKFRIRINVNDIWYEYNFILKIDELHIKYSKLEYKYWSNHENWYSPFKQLSYFDNNTQQFNAFMYEPKLVTINNSNFFNEMKDYYQNNKLLYIDGTHIPLEEFYYKLDFHLNNIKYTIHIHNSSIGNNIFGIIPNNTENNSIISLYENVSFIENHFHITFVLEESGKNKKSEDPDATENIYTLYEGQIFTDEDYQDEGDGSFFIFDDDQSDTFFENNKLLILEWDEGNRGYWVGLNMDNRIFLPITLSYRTTRDNLTINNITKYDINFKDNYLNSILLFDLYELTDEKRNIWNFNSYIDTTIHSLHITNIFDTEHEPNEFNFVFSDKLKELYNNDHLSGQALRDKIAEDFIEFTDKIERNGKSKYVITTRELELINIWWDKISNWNVKGENSDEQYNSNYTISPVIKYQLFEYNNLQNNSTIFLTNEVIPDQYIVPITYIDNYQIQNIEIDITPTTDKKIVKFVNGNMSIIDVKLQIEILDFAVKHGISIRQDPELKNNLVYMYINELNEEVRANVKFKIVYYDIIHNESSNDVTYVKHNSFTLKEYRNIQNLVKNNQMKICIQLYYAKKFNNYGIKHIFNDYSDFRQYCLDNIPHEEDENVSISINYYNSTNDTIEELSYDLYTTNVDEDVCFNQEYFINPENTTDIDTDSKNYVDKISSIKKCLISVNEVTDKFKNNIDVPQNYWIQLFNNDANILSINSDFTNISNYDSVIINWNDKSLEDIKTILDKTLGYLNDTKISNQYETVDEWQRPFYKEYSEFLINQYNYKNIFCLDLTHIVGKYEICCNIHNENINENAIKLCAVILHNDNSINIYENNGDIFNVTDTDKLVKVFLQFDFGINTEDINIIDTLMGDGINAEIFLYKYDDQTYHKVKYYPVQSDENIINPISSEYINNVPEHIIDMTFDNKTYWIDKNSNNYSNELYNRFFKSYNLIGEYSLPDEIKRQYLTNYFYQQRVELTDMFLQYDTYLMHDFNYWYVIFISRDTIDKIDSKRRLYITNHDDIIVPKNNETDRDMKLKFVKHEIQPMINRLIAKELTEQNFNKDDIIVINIENNQKLSFNPVISSKWNIRNISLGKTHDQTITSNNEMCILSTINDNVYAPGYYDVDVRYTLTNNLNKQYKKISRFRINK